MSAVPESTERTGTRPSELVAGYLAAFAIAIGLTGIVWHPLRLVGAAIIVSLVAAGMGGGRAQRLTFAAMMIVTACFFFGLLVAVLTSRPLW